MSRQFVQRRLVASVLASLIALAPAGCAVNMMALPYFLFGGQSLADPAVKLVHKKKDKKKVLVLSYADSNIQWGHDAIDDELCGLLIGKIAAGDSRLEVIPERRVRSWKDMNPDWADKSLQQIGEHFDVDYVIFFECTAFSLNEAKNQFLLQGKTRVVFRVHDVNKDSLVYDNVYQKDYPPNRAVPLTDVNSEEQFRRMFLRRIAQELSWYVVPHPYADEVSDI